MIRAELDSTSHFPRCVSTVDSRVTESVSVRRPRRWGYASNVALLDIPPRNARPRSPKVKYLHAIDRFHNIFSP